MIFLTKLLNFLRGFKPRRNKEVNMDIKKVEEQFKSIFGTKKVDFKCTKATESKGGLIKITNPQSLSDETRKKIEEQMVKNFIKDARDKGEL